MYNLNENFNSLSENEMMSIDGGFNPVGLFALCLALGYAVGKITKYYYG